MTHEQFKISDELYDWLVKSESPATRQYADESVSVAETQSAETETQPSTDDPI